MRRISVDFNTKGADECERVYVVNRMHHPELLDVLKEGERVVLYDDELQMEAILEDEADYGGFFGVLDWSTLAYFPPGTDPSLGPIRPREEQSET